MTGRKKKLKGKVGRSTKVSTVGNRSQATTPVPSTKSTSLLASIKRFISTSTLITHPTETSISRVPGADGQVTTPDTDITCSNDIENDSKNDRESSVGMDDNASSRSNRSNRSSQRIHPQQPSLPGCSSDSHSHDSVPEGGFKIVVEDSTLRGLSSIRRVLTRVSFNGSTAVRNALSRVSFDALNQYHPSHSNNNSNPPSANVRVLAPVVQAEPVFLCTSPQIIPVTNSTDDVSTFDP